MLKELLGVLSGIAFTMLTTGNASDCCSSIKIDHNKPAVYVSVKSSGKDVKCLEIHNNSKVRIDVPVQCCQDATADKAKARHIVPLYRVGNPLGPSPNHAGDVQGGHWIEPGEEAEFCIPKESRMVYVPFSYQWDLDPYIPDGPVEYLTIQPN